MAAQDGVKINDDNKQNIALRRNGQEIKRHLLTLNNPGLRLCKCQGLGTRLRVLCGWSVGSSTVRSRM